MPGINWEKLLAVQTLKGSKFPHGSTQHFVDAVYVMYDKEVSQEIRHHVEKYGHMGGLELWQMEMLIMEQDNEDGDFLAFTVGYFGGSIQELKWAEMADV